MAIDGCTRYATFTRAVLAGETSQATALEDDGVNIWGQAQGVRAYKGNTIIHPVEGCLKRKGIGMGVPRLFAL